MSHPSKLSGGLPLVAGLLSAVVFTTCAAADTDVTATAHAKLGGGPLQAYVGSVALPADGLWTIRAPNDDAEIREVYLVPTQRSQLRQLGSRMYAALETRQVQQGRWHVQMGFEACRQFAQERKGLGPKSIADFADDKRWDYVARRWNTPYFRSSELRDIVREDLEGPFVHLIPEVRFEFAEDPEPSGNPSRQASPTRQANRVTRRVVPSENRVVLAFELRPFIDDGKHWVLYTDGSCQRVDIDPQLLDKQEVTIRPLVDSDRPDFDRQRPNLDYTVVLVASESSGLQTFTAQNQILNQTQTIRWSFQDAKGVDAAKLREQLADARKFAWSPYLMAGSGGVLNVWNGADRTTEAAPANPRRTLSMFSVLGGRAAIEETLQLQDLIARRTDKKEMVNVDSLAGVAVQSHPFEEMLGGEPGGSLGMARVVPADRFFVYVGKPESITALLDTAAPFIANAGAVATGNRLKYNLESRYLERLGMTRDWVDAVLKSGLTSEMAVFAPDLFFIDGTDVTIVARLTQPRLFRGLLGFLGASKLTSEGILTIPTASGGEAYLALRDDLLFAGTHRGEVESSIDLYEQGGKDSLGDSDEMRYMLTQLPVNEETRLYAYLSDPFVRRLVGPRVKIGQRRRMLAKAKMEAVTARALLARLDGQGDPESLAGLVQSEHVPPSWQSEDMTIDSSGLVKLDHYGTLPRMRTLPELPLKEVTPEEAEAYRIYVQNYNSYWRRFFDPIAIRLDEVGSDQLELSTFILPLVDNSIYNALRQMLSHQDDGTELSVPIVEPTPVLQFSVNLKEQAWQQIAGNFSQFFLRYAGASPAMMDDFGPGVHVAIFDADPIIAVGSGDIFGAFGGDVLRGGGDEMVMIPVALSMLTRPCSIMVETKSPERTAQYLRQAASAGIARPRQNRGMGVSFYQVADRDEWVWTMDIFGVVKLRYGVEVVGKYLVIRNIPWSSEDKVVGVNALAMNAAMLQANPAACQQQLPGLFAAASDANRKATMSGLGRLYPFMLSGSEDVGVAATEHQRLFGFYPTAIGDDQWTWQDYRLVSRDYGEPTRQRQPAFDPDRPFGLMNQVDFVKLNMQFEQDGLRSAIRWRLRQ